MITKNEIYTRMVEALPGIYCTQYYEKIPKQLPCVYFRESHSPVGRYITLDMTDEQIRMYCYVDVYGDDIDGIVETIENTFRGMHFIEELAEMIPNYDPDVKRVSLRFGRILTGGNTL